MLEHKLIQRLLTDQCFPKFDGGRTGEIELKLFRKTSLEEAQYDVKEEAQYDLRDTAWGGSHA